jgi:hypothetical protein
MQIVLCRECGERMDWQIHAEHVTAGCQCGTRIAAQYIFPWKQIPAALRAYATKAFGAYGKWRIRPLTALEHAIRRQRDSECAHANACSSSR